MTDFNRAKADFLQSLERGDHRFESTMDFIDTWYEFSPSAFENGSVTNSATQNQGSARVFALSALLGLTQEQTLACFGEHYRDVLATPDADNHQNIRRVLREGNEGISFEQFPLQKKS